MLDFTGLNYWALLVAWLITTGVGAFWYSPAGFGKKWHKLTGIDIMKMPTNEANKTIGFVALSAAVQVLVLGVVLNSIGASTFMEGLVAGLLICLGFVAATRVGNDLYQKLGWKFWWLNSSYFFVVYAVNSVIITLWQ